MEQSYLNFFYQDRIIQAPYNYFKCSFKFMLTKYYECQLYNN